MLEHQRDGQLAGPDGALRDFEGSHGVVSCTMGKFIDLTGKQLVAWTVIERDGYYGPGKTNPLWKCRCVCGKESKVAGVHLRESRSTSCGCLRDGRLSAGQISGSLYGSLRRGAKKRDIGFEVDIGFLWRLFQKQGARCALTGIKIGFAIKGGSRADRTASLDRIDSSRGYTRDNVQWVHRTINFMKQTLSDKEFVRWCNRVTKHNAPSESALAA